MYSLPGGDKNILANSQTLNAVWPLFLLSFQSLIAAQSSAVEWYSPCYDEIIRHEWKGEVTTRALYAIISVTCIIRMENVWVSCAPSVCVCLRVCMRAHVHVWARKSERIGDTHTHWMLKSPLWANRFEMTCSLLPCWMFTELSGKRGCY